MPHLVLIILIKAPMEFRRVTIWALPVQASVTVMTGHEKAKNSSNDENRCPHDRSHLKIVKYDNHTVKLGHAPRHVVQLKISYVSRIHLFFDHQHI
jgi:hypothetical protein